MRDQSKLDGLLDWRPETLDPKRGLSVALIVEGAGVVDGAGEDIEASYAQIGDEITGVAENTDVYVAGVDPSVGAGGYGLGVLLQFLDIGADLIAWGTAAIAVAPRLRAALARLNRRFTSDHGRPKISLSAEAVQVLVIADLCEGSRIEPEAIEQVDCIVHAYKPPEPRTELRQIYCAYTVTVSAFQNDGFYHTWNYLVTPYGQVVSESEVKIPRPNWTYWSDVQIGGRRLRGIA